MKKLDKIIYWVQIFASIVVGFWSLLLTIHGVLISEYVSMIVLFATTIVLWFYAWSLLILFGEELIEEWRKKYA